MGTQLLQHHAVQVQYPVRQLSEHACACSQPPVMKRSPFKGTPYPNDQAPQGSQAVSQHQHLAQYEPTASWLESRARQPPLPCLRAIQSPGLRSRLPPTLCPNQQSTTPSPPVWLYHLQPCVIPVPARSSPRSPPAGGSRLSATRVHAAYQPYAMAQANTAQHMCCTAAQQAGQSKVNAAQSLLAQDEMPSNSASAEPPTRAATCALSCWSTANPVTGHPSTVHTHTHKHTRARDRASCSTHVRSGG